VNNSKTLGELKIERKEQDKRHNDGDKQAKENKCIMRGC
jgi:hypothetical protein